MGIFHKNLNDVGKELGKGTKNGYATALKILNKHLQTEHSIHSDISILINEITSFEEALRELHYSIKSAISSGRPPQVGGFARIATIHVELRQIEDTLKRLLKKVEKEK